MPTLLSTGHSYGVPTLLSTVTPTLCHASIAGRSYAVPPFYRQVTPMEWPRQNSNSNNWCARRDSNPPPRFKRPVLRHQSFGRMVLAAGVEPALTALEEQRLFRSATPAIQAGMKGLEPSIAWSTTRCIGRFATSPWQRRRDSNPQFPVRETGGLATLPTTP